ncbi:MAG: DUF4335 domain-containing protein [Cyanosarcina radialis HA8281-LM2]|jgi:hypothetical protein|nr:DUF4335 domain-containing protein [Cyanosarcina radialis HA8281-LM2]
MALSKSVLRKYTPPTCTLEIKGKESMLSRWAGRTALQDLNFKLSFDDPRQPDDRQVTVWGDRSQLESLNEAVETYIQNFLEQPPATNLIAGKSDRIVDTPPAAKLVNGKANRPAEANEEEPNAPVPSLSPLLQPQQLSPYLEPAGLVSHKLVLGSLQTRESGPAVNLTALQLFDLSQALEEYSTEMVALPPLSGDRTSKFAKIPLWGYATAAGVLLAVGLATQIQPMMKLVNSSNSSQSTAQAPESDSTATSPAPLADNPLPETASDPTAPVPPGSNPLVPVIPGGVASSGPIPGTGTSFPTAPGATSTFPTNPGGPTAFPTAPGGTSAFPTNPGVVSQLPPNLRRTTPGANVPGSRFNPAPGGQSELFSPGGSFQIPSSPGDRTLAIDPRRSISSGSRTSPQQSRNRRPSTTGKTRSNPNSQPRNTLPNVALAPDVYTPDSIFAPSSSFPITSPGSSGEQPQRSRNSARQRQTARNNKPSQTARNNKPAAQTPTPTEPLTTAAAPESLLTPSAPPLNLPAINEQDNNRATAPSPNLGAISPVTPLPQTIPSPTAPSATSLEVPKTSSDGAAQLAPPSAGGFSLPSPNSGSGDTAYNPSSQERLFDRIPQVTEARNYFQERWKPPTDLPQSKLEYTLVINNNGSVERIIPLTSAAGNYIGRTGMPKPGSEQLVSPLQGEGNAKIRVVLYKDGQVETLLEP